MHTLTLLRTLRAGFHVAVHPCTRFETLATPWAFVIQTSLLVPFGPIDVEIRIVCESHLPSICQQPAHTYRLLDLSRVGVSCLAGSISTRTRRATARLEVARSAASTRVLASTTWTGDGALGLRALVIAVSGVNARVLQDLPEA